MTLLERALGDAVAALESLRIDYVVVGGIANAVWGEPRATVDVDITVAVEQDRLDQTVEAVASRFRTAVTEPIQFVRQTRVLPIDTESGVRVDLIFALVPFELEAIARGRTVTIGGRSVRVATPEDLILMKIVSDRPRDLADADAIARRQLAALDRAYLDPRLRELSVDLEKPEILERWNALVSNQTNPNASREPGT